jgi:hypothetical protein
MRNIKLCATHYMVETNPLKLAKMQRDTMPVALFCYNIQALPY